MTEKILSNCQIYIVPYGLLKKRIKLFEAQIAKYGGKVVCDASDSVITHILIEDSYLLNPVQVKNALNLVGLSQNTHCDIVGTLWLSKSLKENKLLNTEEYSFIPKVKLDIKQSENYCEPPVKVKTKLCQKNDEINDVNDVIQENNLNETIINQLQKLADSYRFRGDKWRSLAYDKAVISLKSYPQCINNINELKSLPNISAKMFDKISEIMENGCLSKVQNFCNDEKTVTLEIFGKIWGAGPVTAQLWYQKGYRTLEDLKSNNNLTSQQKIGLKYYNEIQEPIPRSEVEEIIDVVRNAVLEVEPTLRIVPCGSYRRGKQTCGDIDVLLISNDSINYGNVLPKIICLLKLQSFLIEDLIGTENSNSYFKYLGLCKLNREKSKVRRLDIFIVPERESACAILHYTGSALFNRAMRIHASKMKMHLSQRTLTITIPQVKILPTPTEEAIFEHLGLEFRLVEDREIF